MMPCVMLRCDNYDLMSRDAVEMRCCRDVVEGWLLWIYFGLRFPGIYSKLGRLIKAFLELEERTSDMQYPNIILISL